MKVKRSIKQKHMKIVSYLLTLSLIMMIIPLHLFPCFIAGFLAYECILFLTPFFERIFGGSRARLMVVTLIAVLFIIFITFLLISLVNFVTSILQRGVNITLETNRIFYDLKQRIPDFLPSFLPESAEELKDQMIIFIESHLITIRNIGRTFLHGLITIFIGLIIGAIIALNKPSGHTTYLIHEIMNRVHYLSQAFRQFVFAQIKVSVINTLLTAVMIFILFPIFKIHFPLSSALIMLTFIFGLIPIIGNLISNFIILLSALSISFTVGGIMVGYLIVIHKLEYFLNAKIVGNYIHAKSWELLLAMLVFEATFGMEGIVAAPIYYSYLKIELREHGLI